MLLYIWLAASLAHAMRENCTIREINLLGQKKAFGDACLQAFIDMFEYNVTLTKIIWRLDSRKSFAINKLLVRNNTIKKNIEEKRDNSKYIPEHCNISELRVAAAVGLRALSVVAYLLLHRPRSHRCLSRHKLAVGSVV